MSEPVLMDSNELKALRDDMKKVVGVNDGLTRDLKVARDERDQAKGAATKAKTEADRLRKLVPAVEVQDEIKGLRTAVSEGHKRIGILEKELAAAKAESEGRRKEAVQLNQRLVNVQNTFDMMQASRDKAHADRDKGLADLQVAADAYHKLQGEFNDFKKEVAEREAENKKPGKAAPKAEPAKA